MSEPAVSVIIPVLNEERFLKQSVQAILNQNYSGQLEIILALGPSKDQTNIIAQELAKDQRIKLLENTYLKKHSRVKYLDKNVIYIMTNEYNKKN